MKNKFLIIAVAAIIGASCCACSSASDEGQSSKPNSASSQSAGDSNKAEELGVGEEWVVDGQWSLVINSVSETDERNEFAESKPKAVYVIDYTYKNIGYKSASGLMDGLFFSMYEGIVDNAGVVGYSYPGDVTNPPKETPIGASCNAQSTIGVDNAGAFKITVTAYDSESNKQSVTFAVPNPQK